MKHLLMTTALVMVTATGAMAASHEMKPMTSMETSAEGDIKASELIGMRIYATENAQSLKAKQEDRDWDDIGEVNDVILNMDGSVKAVILGVGGFLGMGEKDVAIQMDSLHVVQEQDNDDFFLVVNANKEGLSELAEYVDDEEAEEETEEAMNNAETETEEAAENAEAETEEAMNKAEGETEEAAENAEAETEATMAETETAMEATRVDRGDDPERVRLAPPEVLRDGYVEADRETLTTEDLTGARVYGSNDEDIGEVNSLLLTADGKSISRALLDIGGFIGIGEHQIAVTLDELKILREDGGDDLKVFIDATQEALEAQPAYQE